MDHNLINVTEKAVYDNSITSIESHSYLPFNTNFGESDIISIVINQSDSLLLLSTSYIYIEGTFNKTNDSLPSVKSKLTNNSMAYLFDECKYLLNNQIIDSVKELGISSTMKGYCGFNSDCPQASIHTRWSIEPQLIDKGKFNFCVPLKSLLGIADDFQKILINAKHELILIRSRSNQNAFITTDNEAVSLNLTKIIWRCDQVRLNDVEKLNLLRTIEINKSLQVWFRSWDIITYPNLPQTTSHMWNLKTTNSLERPRYVIVGFQTDRKNKDDKDCSKFDHINIRSLKLKLNSEIYPYEDFNVNFESNQYSIIYELYTKFQLSYYGQINRPLLNYAEFKENAPFFVIDCSRQVLGMKEGLIDVKIMFETTSNILPNTNAFALILNDKILSYNPLTGIVKQL